VLAKRGVFRHPKLAAASALVIFLGLTGLSSATSRSYGVWGIALAMKRKVKWRHATDRGNALLLFNPCGFGI